ncbi:Ribosomal L1 domain-containing protein 1 [Coemansia sp. RSA 2706]|nr:Ribosomal L1 domain-containing protein 1 [Coemansia sp. RSA 2706]KAJ2311420.1 Ribosomal L1 domain-containing protein 1 [Coemansia sp. RSA 2705]KAJ2324247.1 Ribosomal L1 domain-containing protein 1 [Coemansia sp. RSA 2702]
MPLNHELVTKAVTSLIEHTRKKHESEESTNLLANSVESMHLIITLKKVSHKMRHKPYRIPLRNCLYDDSSSVCLLIKKFDEDHVEKLKNLGFPVIKQIVAINELKTKYSSFESKRDLMNSHDLFLTDDRMVHSLPKALGGKFYLTKKIPAPVNLRAKNLRHEVGKALKCTYYRAARGSCNAVRIGTTDMPVERLVDNVEDTLAGLVRHIPKNWDNIQTVGIKASTSLTLPIYNSAPSAATIFEDVSANSKAEDEDGDEEMNDTAGASDGTAESAPEGATKNEEKADAKDKKDKKDKNKKNKEKSKKSPLSRKKAKSLVKTHSKKRAEAASA